MEQGLILLITALIVVVPPGAAQLFSTAQMQSDTQVNITLEGCGDTKVCKAQPPNCDPAGNGTCLFTSLHVSNGTDLSIQLRGGSVGLVGLGLVSPQGVVMVFACAQNYLNNTLTFLGISVQAATDLRGLAQNNAIYCEFNVPSAVSNDAIFNIFLFAGSFNMSSTNFINITNVVATTTTAPNTTMPHNMTTPNTTMPHNMTTPNTTMPHNMTTPTTMMPHNMTTPTTMMPNNMSTPIMMMPNNTMTPTTMMPHNTTTPTTMMPHNTTTAASMTLHPHSLLLPLSVVTLAVLQIT